MLKAMEKVPGLQNPRSLRRGISALSPGAIKKALNKPSGTQHIRLLHLGMTVTGTTTSPRVIVHVVMVTEITASQGTITREVPVLTDGQGILMY